MLETIHPPKNHLPALKSLWKDAFSDSDEEIDAFFTTAFSPERCLCILSEEEVAAAAYWFDCSYENGKLAYLYAVATAKRYRGQGLCHHLLGQIHDLLADKDYAGTVLVPAEGLAGLYQSMDYRFFCRMKKHSCIAEQPTSLLPLTKNEYAALRRRYLPSGGVIQEGENLDYLETMASFFAGDGTVLAVSAKEPVVVLELLGDPAKSIGVHSAADDAKAGFFCPEKAEFAMFRPLKKVPAPMYFGFAFD